MKQCEICGETKGQIYGKAAYGMDLCRKHYTHLRRHGEILERTTMDSNEYVVNGNVTEIILYDKSYNESGRALIDTKFIDIAKEYKWCISNNYVAHSCNGKTTKLHRLVTNAPDGLVVDHINHNPLDNRLSNLRVCTQSENMCNTVNRSDNTSGYKGVYWDKSRGLWMASIQVKNKSKHLGRFPDINDAIEARRKAVEKYFGEFAYNPESDVSYATQSQPLVNQGEQC